MNKLEGRGEMNMKIRLAAITIAVLMAVTLSAMAAGQDGGGDKGNKGPKTPGGPDDC